MNKGFTLIELLAVIVILAIISVIATPIVLNIINDTKDSAILRSAEHYIDAVEISVAKKKLENRKFRPETCDIDEGNLLCDDGVFIEVEVNNEKPISGGINYKDGRILEFELIYETVVVRQDSSGNIIEEKEFTINEPDNIVYFDVSEGKVCSKEEYKVENSKTGYNGLNGTGNQNSCLKFYKFSDNADGTVNLLLDHNTTAVNEWYDGSTNTQGPITTLLQLKEDTKNWNGTIEPESTVTVNGDTIDYTGFKARLISALEIAQIVDHSSWDSSKIINDNYNGNWYYFATKTLVAPKNCRTGNSSECVYGWLYDRTSLTCKSRGCLNNSNVETFGYWTDTSVPAKVTATVYGTCDGYVAFGVSHKARVGSVCVNNKEHYGIRPVITVNH